MVDKHIIKIDSKATTYQPFIILFIFLILVFILFVTKSKTSETVEFFRLYFWYFFGVIILLELVLYKIVIPKERIEIIKYENGEFVFHYLVNEKIEDKEQIEKMSYWWNYAFGRSTSSTKDFDPSGRGNNSGHGGRGIANGLHLYIKLESESGKKILLYEKLGNWSSTPHWKYSLEEDGDFNEKYICHSLKKFVEKIK